MKIGVTRRSSETNRSMKLDKDWVRRVVAVVWAAVTSMGANYFINSRTPWGLNGVLAAHE